MNQTTRRHRIVLTGSDGELGRALLPLLAGHDVICLDGPQGRPRATTTGGDIRASIRVDLCDLWLGLPPQTYEELASWATVAIHLPAVADVANARLDGGDVERAEGLRQFAEEADALLLHVSTAFDGAAHGTPAARTSALRAEGVVHAASCRSTIVRTSTVVGDAWPGPEPHRQAGPEATASPGAAGPTGPVPPWWLLDAVPQDLVAAALVALLDGRAAGRTVWLTLGDRALTAESIGASMPEGLLATCRPDVLPTSVPELLGMGVEELGDVALTVHRMIRRAQDVTTAVAS